MRSELYSSSSSLCCLTSCHLLDLFDQIRLLIVELLVLCRHKKQASQRVNTVGLQFSEHIGIEGYLDK